MSELARLAGVTQPRMTQIMNLNHLTPDIQEELLFLPLVKVGPDRVHERIMRSVAKQWSCVDQRERWQSLVTACTTPDRRARGARRTSMLAPLVVKGDSLPLRPNARVPSGLGNSQW